MAEQNATPDRNTDELVTLRQQLEEIQKRLEELSAVDTEVQSTSSAASPLEAQESSLQSEDNEAEVCADASELHEDNTDSAASSSDADSAVQPAEAAAQVDSSVSSEDVQTSQCSATDQPSAEPVEYEPYVPPSAAAHRPNVEEVPDISTSSSVYKQQANSAAQQTASQKPAEAQSEYAHQAAYSQQQAAQSQAQQTAQAQNPYGGTHAGQQVPFGQTDPQQQYYQQAQQAYYSYGVHQNAYQAPLARTKDHVAAALLGIFLGVFGIHKFYLGYHTAGFIMLGVSILGSLITFGLAACVMWLIGVIEGVIYLVKDQAEFEQVYVFKKREWF